MKRAVSISIGSSKRNKAIEISLLGETVRIERIGTDGDMEKAAQLYRELDGQVDAFGVGGADLGVMVDEKWYPLYSVKKMVRFVQKTPLVDGTGLFTDWLARAPRLTMLCTSRVPLDLYGEHEWPLSPLAVPDLAEPPNLEAWRQWPAMELLLARARAAEPGFDLDFVELEKVYRQNDSAFIALLNAIRNRTVDDIQLDHLNGRCDPEFVPPEDEFYITLTSTNDLAAARNREKLAALRGRARRYEGAIDGEFDRRSLPTEEALELKAGAQVMLLTNDRRGRWVNGTVARVTSIRRSEDTDGDDIVSVELPDGDEADITPATWELFRFRYDADADRIESEAVGSFTQYPLRLAWAVTIHKSQGKTFDKVVIDIGRGAFAHGQVYVALSRCTAFEGLVLRTPIRRGHILMDWRIVRFLTRFQYRKAEEALPAAAKRALLQEAIAGGREVEIVYLKPDDTKTRRRVTPESVEQMEYRGRTFEGLRAYCHKRRASRTFRLDRILEIA